MADKGPNYDIERLKLAKQISEHKATIRRGHARKVDIDDQKAINLQEVEIQNATLDEEARKIDDNEAALIAAITEIEKNRDLMVKPDKASKE